MTRERLKRSDVLTTKKLTLNINNIVLSALNIIGNGFPIVRQ